MADQGEIDEESRREEERIARALSNKGRPTNVTKKLGGTPNASAVLSEVQAPPKLKPTTTVDKSQPQIEGATVRKNNNAVVFQEIKQEQKLKPTETIDKSAPVIEPIQLRKNERPTLMQDIKQAGGTEGLQSIKAGSSASKAKLFEQKIADQKEEKAVKKTVWAEKGTNRYAKKTVYDLGPPPPKKSLSELLAEK